MHTWKYHKETRCVATFISNKLKCHGFIFSLFSPQNQRTGIWNNSCPGVRAGNSGRREAGERG
jgi:hypothetical protein